MDIETYFYKKEIDWSLLNQGFTIPLHLQGVLYHISDSILRHGEVKTIKLVLNGKTYVEKLINLNFDRQKYLTHKDILQVRYNPKSEIAVALRSIFQNSYSFISEKKRILGKSKRPIDVPLVNREYLVIYLTDFDDTWNLECITSDEVADILAFTKTLPEIELEQIFDRKDTAEIIERYKTVKIRKLDRKISDRLKQVYEFRCQICGE